MLHIKIKFTVMKNSRNMLRILFQNLKNRKFNNMVNGELKTDVLPVIKEAPSPSFSIRGVSDKKIQQIRICLEKQRKGSCFTLDIKFMYALRKIQKFYFPEHKYRIFQIEDKIKVFKIN